MSPVAVAPNGDIAYVARRRGTRQLFLRPLDSLEARPVRGTEGAEGPLLLARRSIVWVFCGSAAEDRLHRWWRAHRARTCLFMEQPRRKLGKRRIHRFLATEASSELPIPGLGEPESLTIPAAAELPHRFPQVLPGNRSHHVHHRDGWQLGRRVDRGRAAGHARANDPSSKGAVMLVTYRQATWCMSGEGP